MAAILPLDETLRVPRNLEKSTIGTHTNSFAKRAKWPRPVSGLTDAPVAETVPSELATTLPCRSNNSNVSVTGFGSMF